MELVISNSIVPIRGFGEEIGKNFTELIAGITNLEIVPLIAAHFNTKAFDRHHPGHQILVQFIPAKEEFSTNEPVMVKFRVTNIGKTDIAYYGGSGQPVTRDMHFAFTSDYVRTKTLIDGSPWSDVNRFPGRVSLKPGEIYEQSVDLKEWVNFTTDLNYLMTGSYLMLFCDPVSKDSRTIWEDFASARFQIRFKK